MQNDWSKWLPMAKFVDNNAISFGTSMTPFFANKGFHPRMSFSSNDTAYTTARERIGVARAEDITDTMQNILEVMKSNSKRAQEAMTRQANKRRKAVEYQVGDKVFLSSRNINIDRPTKKLEDKMLGPFPIIKRVGASYKLELSASMKIHDVFHPNLLRVDLDDPLSGQVQEPPGPIVTPEGEEYELDDILNSRWHYERLQYRCKWTNEKQRDMQWYYVDGDEFKGAVNIVKDYHDNNLMTLGSRENVTAPRTRRQMRP